MHNPRHAGDPASAERPGAGGSWFGTTPGAIARDTSLATPEPETSQAGPSAGAEFDPLTWLRKNGVLLAALVLIGLQLWWKATLLAHSYFRLDDFFALERSGTHGLTWSYLMQENAGQLSPLGKTIAWFVIRLSPLDWTLATATTLTLLTVTCLALFRMLRTLWGDRPGILIILLVYLVSPLSFSGMTWWGVTLYELSLQLGIFCAVTAHVNYLRTGRFRHAVAAACWLVVALGAMIKGVGLPLLLFALTWAFFSTGTWWRAALATLRDHWRVWVLYAVPTAGYVIVYVIQLGSSSLGPTKPKSFSGVFSFADNMLRNTFVPGALGGPWHWVGTGVEAIASPPAPLAWATCLVGAAVIVVSLWYKPRAWRAWAIMAGWLVLVDLIPVLLGRGVFAPGAILGLTTRYVWDALAVLTICLGLAFLPMPGEAAPRHLGPQARTYLRTALAGVLTVVVIGAGVSLSAYKPDPTAAQGKSFVATARIALADVPPGSVIVDEPYPEPVAGGVFFGTMGRESSLFASVLSGPAGERPRFIEQPDGVYPHLLEFDGWGRLVPPRVAGVGNKRLPRRDRGCWTARHGIVTVPLKKLAAGGNTLSIGYLAGSSSQLVVEFGGHSDVATFLGGGLKTAFLPVQGAGDTVTIQSLGGGIPCIGGATVGFLQPGAGPAIPQFAVNG